MSSVDVFAADEQSAEPVDALRWVRLARSVLRAQGVKGDTEVSLLFVDEAAMAELNQRFLGGEGPTDVLAFPIDDDEVAEGGRSPDSLGPSGPQGGDSGPAPFSGPPGGGPGFGHGRDDVEGDRDDRDMSMADAPALLGDVVVCPAVARRNAPTHAGTYEDEIALLVVHGILHLLGMDHVDHQEATAMERREQELLDRFHRAPR
ncbi:MAG: rRNA maturation RNase YbeY [Actinomycetota bacterium]|nr:rRNA maturation RNase YbeY [Actinomycetota bacterium]